MSLKKIQLIAILCITGITKVLSQPCLPDFLYRVPVTINNPAVGSQSGVIEFTFRAADLISDMKMLSTCADLRFTQDNGVLLKYWIDENSSKTNAQRVWVELPEMAPGNTTIYMFYGNPNAASRSDTSIFDFFDDFSNSDIADNWNVCNGSATVSSGSVTIGSNTVLTTKKMLDRSYTLQANVTQVQVSSGTVQASLGQVPWNSFTNQYDEGYAMSYNTTGTYFEINLVSEDCPQPETVIGNTGSTTYPGIWTFSWKLATEAMFRPPNLSETSFTVDSLDFYTSFGSCLSLLGYGSMKVDWVSAWKISDDPFTATVGTEVQVSSSADIEISGNTNICGDGTNDLVLSATFVSGGYYTWIYNSEDTLSSGTEEYIYSQSPATTVNSGNYSVVVTIGSPGCSGMTPEVDINVDPIFNRGTITADTVVCAETNSGKVKVSGYNGSIDRWEYREMPGSIWNSLNVQDDIYDYSGLSKSYAFRAYINDGACGSDTSYSSLVTVNSTTSAGILSSDATLCPGSSGELSISGYTGSILRWEKMISGSVWDTLSHAYDTLSFFDIRDTTSYRVAVMSGVCPERYSNTVLLQVCPNTEAGNVTGGKYVCGGNSDMDTLGLQSYIGDILRWEYAPTKDGPWNEKTSHDNYFVYQGLDQTTFYRALVQSKVCEAKYSAIDSVIAEDPPSGGVLSGSKNICSTVNSGYLSLGGYSGKIVGWVSSVDSDSWLPLNRYSDTLQYKNLQQKTWYRTLVNTRHEACNTDTSTIATVDVSQITESGTLFSTKTRFCADTNNGTIRIINKTGDVIQWENSSTGLAPWSAILNTDDSLPFENMPSTTYYRAIVRSGTCPKDTTPALLIRIDQPTEGGTILGSTEVCGKVNVGSLNLMGYHGTIERWESSYDGLTWNTVPDLSGSTYTYSGLTDTTLYRVLLKSGECSEDTSTIGKITVNPLPDVSFTANDANLGDKTYFKNTSVISGGIVQSWSWDFGNEEGSSSKNPGYVYPTPGTYRVKLTATSNKACTDSASGYVHVYDLPDVNFTYQNVCLNSNVEFVNSSAKSTGTTYTWNFGDGSPESSSVDASHLYAAANTYRVTLIAMSSSGGIDSVSKYVTVYPRSTPDFLVQNICEGNVASCSNRTQPVNLSLTWEWDFGNDLTDTRSDPDVTYESDGVYLIRLKATTTYGCTDSISKTITVYPQPNAAFSVDNVPYQQPSVFFNESEIEYGNLNYHWDFGDGNTSDTTNPVYVYEAAGVYSVELTVRSDSGCTSSVSKDVKIFSLPVAKFSVTDVCIGDTSLFVNESVISSGTLHYEWSFGDGKTSGETSPAHLYSSTGTYNIRLICISDKGGRDTVYKNTKIFDLPVVDFDFNEACDGAVTNFSNNSEISDGDISSVLWDFGDGTNSIQQNPDKLYLNPAIYKVNLLVQSSTGCSNSVKKDVIVHRNPVSDFEAQGVCVGKNTEFVNHTSIDNTDRPYILSYQWDLGDGKTSDTPGPEHEYSKPGIYKVQLLVTSDAGCSDSLTRYIEVFSLPDADAGADTTVIKGFPINLEASGGTSYEWYPTDGLSDFSVPDPVARPMETTTYSLRVSDENNCVNYDTLTITVEDAMKIIPSNVITPNGNGENDSWNIINIDSYPEAKISVFDRWGKEVFETTGYNNDWNGLNKNGDILPDGTYYYVIVLSKEAVYKGAVTILRDR